MTDITESFGNDGKAIAAQIISISHFILAFAGTIVVWKKRKELKLSIIAALLVTWLVPLVGPIWIMVGLSRPSARKTA